MREGEADRSIVTPAERAGLLNRIARGQRVPAMVARWTARRKWGPIRLGRNIYVTRHADVCEALCRDLEFAIAPINSRKIAEVNDGPFVLGMDRSAELHAERRALYGALGAVDLDELRKGVEREIADRLGALRAGGSIEVVEDYARPIAAHTAQRLFGITGPNDRMFMEVTRSIFAHTFLNLGNKRAVRERAIRAGRYMAGWLADEIKRRRDEAELGHDMMGHLLRQGLLDDDGVRRTLGGMMVGSVDTTASAVAKILKVAGSDAGLLSRMSRDAGDLRRMHGWCNEALRRWPHNPLVMRKAVVDAELSGRSVKPGDTVWAITQAAMQDPSVFIDPDRLRPDRDPSIYLHLGGGLHPCAGRSVNSFQIPLLVASVLRRGVARIGKVKWTGPFPGQLKVTLREGAP